RSPRRARHASLAFRQRGAGLPAPGSLTTFRSGLFSLIAKSAGVRAGRFLFARPRRRNRMALVGTRRARHTVASLFASATSAGAAASRFGLPIRIKNPADQALGRKTMRHRLGWSVTAAAAVMLSLAASHPISAQNGVALTGQVGSAEEGAMEGVVVSAKK